MSVTVHYVATGTFPMAAGQWEVLLEDGQARAARRHRSAARWAGRSTPANGSTSRRSADITATPKNLFVVYVDTKTSEMILAVPIS